MGSGADLSMPLGRAGEAASVQADFPPVYSFVGSQLSMERATCMHTVKDPGDVAWKETGVAGECNSTATFINVHVNGEPHGFFFFWTMLKP